MGPGGAKLSRTTTIVSDDGRKIIHPITFIYTLQLRRLSSSPRLSSILPLSSPVWLPSLEFHTVRPLKVINRKFHFIYPRTDKKGMMMPFIIFEFLCIALWIALEVLTVLVMAVYLTTSVDITTTVRTLSAECRHWHLVLPGQCGGHHGHLDGAAVLPLALRGVPLPDPGRGHEHGFRQGQSVTGGRDTIVLNHRTHVGYDPLFPVGGWPSHQQIWPVQWWQRWSWPPCGWLPDQWPPLIRVTRGCHQGQSDNHSFFISYPDS